MKFRKRDLPLRIWHVYGDTRTQLAQLAGERPPKGIPFYDSVTARTEAEAISRIMERDLDDLSSGSL